MIDTEGLRPMEALHNLLRRPTQLGLVLNASLLAAWYGATYMPFQRAIAEDEARLATNRERLELAREVEHLRRQADRFQDYLPETEEGDPWIPFLMAGAREFPIKLVALDPRPPADIGPYKAPVYRVVVEGPFPELERFLRWLEGSPRLIRVDSIRVITKAAIGVQGATTNEMQLTVMGLEG
ncbi:acylphosphatase [Tautonia sociabilis]|uniref:Pilus assembly protein PilO n=1 Tax=Tautonia sociabilis TaxID=2080755 RepID=A0A432MES2_9BACT|nr:hypothetical protein [Tautonia sociabilis]RUL84177.1 hypothetical protein TsocGM_20850 [Tautonia sociabilis]